MTNLYNVDSPINREQRNNLNATFEDILRRFGHLQRQINILSGGQEVDEILTRLEQAIANAETGIQDYINQVDNTVQQAIDANNTATQDAISTNSTALQTALQTVSDTLSQLNTAIVDAETATQDTTTAKNNAIQATSDAQASISALQSLINNFGSRGQFVAGTQYYKNNIVSDGNGNSYIALVDNINVGLADTSKWMLFAKKGEKGDRGEKGDTGAALSIQGRLNDESELPTTGEAGQAYTINGVLYVWSENGASWENVGNIKGEKGDTGDTGETGKSAYQSAVDKGFIGSEAEWLLSLKGEKGDTPDLTNIEQSIEEIDDRLTTHLDEIATIEKLGHIKPDGTTLAVDSNGVASVIGGGGSNEIELVGRTIYVGTTRDFTTISAAIASVKKFIKDSNINIYVDAGTYTENIVIQGFSGGTINLRGIGSVFVNGAIATISSYNQVIISDFNIKSPSNASSGITVSSCYSVSIANCTIETTASTAIALDVTSDSYVTVNSCTIKNSATALSARDGGLIITNTLGGTGNNLGIRATRFGRVSKAGYTLTATTAEQVQTGGQIV